MRSHALTLRVRSVVAEFVPSNIGRQLLAGSAAVRAAGEHAPPGESGAAPARPGDALTPPIAAGRRGSAVSSSASALSLPGATSAPSSSSSLPGVVVAPGMVAAAAASVNGTRAAAVVAAASAQASATAAAAASAASHARPTRSAIERALSRAVSSTDELLRIPRAAVMAKAQRAPQFPYAQLLGHMQGAGGNAGGRRAPRPTSLPRSAGAVHAAPAEHVRTRGVSQRAR